MADFENFKKVWNLLSYAYPSWAKEVSPDALGETLKLYHMMLQDLETGLLKAAAMQHIATSRFFPTVAELRELADRLRRPRVPHALEAWAELRETYAEPRVAFFRFGHPPEFENRILQRVVDTLGWAALTNADEYDRNRFVNLYDRLVEEHLEDSRMLPQVAKLTQQPERRRLEPGE